MTLGEAHAVMAEWRDAPPLVFLVEALVHGFGGGAPAKQISDGDLATLSVQAGPALPIVRRDAGLPAPAPVFDLDELRQKNAARISAAHLKDRKVAG